MEWVEGMDLYAWAERNKPSSSEVARVLAQVARALAATHAAGGVHRDVKGENIRVDSTGRARLVDFGAGSYAGAERITREGLPPGTDAYRSPEAWEFELHRPRNTPVVYEVKPADDVYSLGVCGWRLLTGGYPPEVEVSEQEGRYDWCGTSPERHGSSTPR
jgi:serine/threonine protein kinase